MTAPRPEICACLFAHEMLRRLGIVSADIYIDLRCPGYFGVAVRTAGKEWLWLLGALPTESRAFLEEWNAGAIWWNTAGYEALEALNIDASPQMAMATAVIQSLLVKGIPLDPLADVRAQDTRRKAAN